MSNSNHIAELAALATPEWIAKHSIQQLASRFAMEAGYGRTSMVRARAAYAEACCTLALAFVNNSHVVLERIRTGENIALDDASRATLPQLLREIHGTAFWIDNEIATNYALSAVFDSRHRKF